MKTALIPGPRGDQYAEIRADILGFMERCAREYGDIVAFDAADRSWVMVTDPDLVHEILTAPVDQVAVGPSLIPG
ncbi:MAG: cytochrome P450, partial [Chloroflexota bacterium]|nr:cytochrome P450 [Chloroflexota bacterium]